MNDVALYRKYRPKNFREVIGQDHIVKPLEESIRAGSISHAYLFSGSRGTGKTSVARIFAEAIGTAPEDIIEMDAASNRGIDDVRLLRDGVSAMPFRSKYKVYIIDEVHMLTKEAFNALLKTLEEPPRHALFILATTEIDKLPETVISRCQIFVFKRPSRQMLKDTVTGVAKKEGFSIAPASAELISLLGDGSFRDALGVLQKAISSSSDKKLSIEDVGTVLGAPKAFLVNNVILAVAEKNSEKGLSAVREAAAAGLDMKLFLKLVLAKLRLALLLRFAPAAAAEISPEVSEEDFVFLKNLAAKKESAISSKILVEFLNAYDLVGVGAIPELPMELAVINSCF